MTLIFDQPADVDCSPDLDNLGSDGLGDTFDSGWYIDSVLKSRRDDGRNNDNDNYFNSTLRPYEQRV